MQIDHRSEVLDRLRAGEAASDLALIAAPDPNTGSRAPRFDLEAVRVATAWRGCAPVWVTPRDDPPADRRELRAWAWSSVFIDWITLADRARIAVVDVRRIFESLRDGGLVYPDGSLHTHLERLLVERYTSRAEEGSKL